MQRGPWCTGVASLQPREVTPDELARRLARTQHGVVTAGQARACGLLPDDVRVRVRAGLWLRVFQGAYLVDAPLYDDLPTSARMQAALLVQGPRAVLGLRSAAEVHGLQGLIGGPLPVDVVLPRGLERHQREGISLHWWPLRRDEVTVIAGLRVTVVPRTLADLVPRVDRPTGLCLLDSALHLKRMEVADLATVAATAADRPGAVAARPLWSLADGRAASPLESRIRLACIDGDVAPDELQYPVRDRWGDLLGIGDLAWLRRRRPLVAEGDGAAVHDAPPALYRDRHRGNDFVLAGCDVVRFTWADAYRPAYLANVVHRALLDAA